MSKFCDKKIKASMFKTYSFGNLGKINGKWGIFWKFTTIDIIIVKACLTIKMKDLSKNLYDKKEN